MAQHVKILGILHIVFGAMGVFAAVVVLLIFGGISALVSVSDRSTDLPAPILGVIGSVIFIIVLVLSLPGLIIGIGLMQFRPWARIGGIVLSALDLLGFPFHTALGVYGLWVLLNRQTEQMFGVPPVRAV
jgi:uncharacterized membrane protein